MTVQILLAPEDLVLPVMVSRPFAVLDALLRVPAEVRAICSGPRPVRVRRRRRVQADFWPRDPHPPRPGREKPITMGLKPLSQEEEVYRLDVERREQRHRLPVLNAIPPRSDCRGGPRPCPLVSCSYNLYLDRTSSGAVKLAFPNLEPWEIPKTRSCALDVADRGGAGTKYVAKAMNLTDERIRQIQVDGMRKIAASDHGREVLMHLRDGGL